MSGAQARDEECRTAAPTWALTGALRQRADLRMLGLVLLAVALTVEACAQALPSGAGAVVAVAAWAAGGLGMGMSYPRLYAAPLDEASPAGLTAIAAAVSFAELAVLACLAGAAVVLAIGTRTKISSAAPGAS